MLLCAEDALVDEVHWDGLSSNTSTKNVLRFAALFWPVNGNDSKIPVIKLIQQVERLENDGRFERER